MKCGSEEGYLSTTVPAIGEIRILGTEAKKVVRANWVTELVFWNISYMWNQRKFPFNNENDNEGTYT